MIRSAETRMIMKEVAAGPESFCEPATRERPNPRYLKLPKKTFAFKDRPAARFA